MDTISINVVITVLFVLLVLHLMVYVYTRLASANKAIKRLCVLGTCLGAWSASSVAGHLLVYITPI